MSPRATPEERYGGETKRDQEKSLSLFFTFHALTEIMKGSIIKGRKRM